MQKSIIIPYHKDVKEKLDTTWSEDFNMGQADASTINNCNQTIFSEVFNCEELFCCDNECAEHILNIDYTEVNHCCKRIKTSIVAMRHI